MKSAKNSSMKALLLQFSCKISSSGSSEPQEDKLLRKSCSQFILDTLMYIFTHAFVGTRQNNVLMFISC